MLKKNFLTLVLVVFLVLMLVSCNNGAADVTASDSPSAEPTNTPDASESPGFEIVDNPQSVNIVECMFYGDSMENLEYKEAWPAIVEEHYGVPVTMVTPDRTGYMETIRLAAESGELHGIVELFGGPYLDEWKAEGLIYPLTDFLANNEVWNTLIPDYWKDAYTIDGELWAIPTGADDNPSWSVRTIRGDWLTKLGLEKPGTIDEFYEASHEFTYDDPDGNGRDDTAGFTANGLWGLQDVFQAFDARLNHLGEAKAAWNPNTELWEDSMLKSEMAECLEFLNKCYEENVLDNECFSGISGEELRAKATSGYFGGTVYWDAWTLSFEMKLKEIVPDARYLSIGALSHFVDKNLNHYQLGNGGAPRVMMKTTSQPKETINWYVNTFFGDEWGFFTGRLGPVGEVRGQEGRACTIENNTIVRNTYIDNDGSIKTYIGPGFIGGLPARALYSVYEIAYYVPNPPEGFESWGEDTAKKGKDSYARRRAVIDEYIDNGMAYLLPEFCKKSVFLNDSNLSKTGEALIIKAIKGEVSVDSALSEYKEYASTIGIDSALDRENEKLGKTSTNKNN